MSSISSLHLPRGSDDEQTFLWAFQLASLPALSMALVAVIQLDVLEIMAAAGPGAYVSPSEIASHLHTHNPDSPAILDRLLRLLATYSIVTTSDNTVETLYGLGPVCKFLLKNEDGGSLSQLLLMLHDKLATETSCYFREAVLDGGFPFQKARGLPAYEYIPTDARVNKLVNSGLSELSTLVMEKILQVYLGFEGVKQLVDVGGGSGATLNLIVSKYPHIKGINFDLHHVIDDAPAYPGVEHMAGNMFDVVPSADAIFMKYILHNWNDEDCLKLLKNCYKALPASGKVIIVEMASPAPLETNLAANNVFHVDVFMLAFSAGGKERTQQQLQDLATAAAFTGFRPVCRVYNTWVIELLK